MKPKIIHPIHCTASMHSDTVFQFNYIIHMEHHIRLPFYTACFLCIWLLPCAHYYVQSYQWINMGWVCIIIIGPHTMVPGSTVCIKSQTWPMFLSHRLTICYITYMTIHLPLMIQLVVPSVVSMNIGKYKIFHRSD